MKSLKRKSALYITIIGFAVLLTTPLFAQEKIRVFEIATPDFGQFNLRYKFGNENRLFRISAIGFDRISRTY